MARLRDRAGDVDIVYLLRGPRAEEVKQST
jgi:hypothetical protein